MITLLAAIEAVAAAAWDFTPHVVPAGHAFSSQAIRRTRSLHVHGPTACCVFPRPLSSHAGTVVSGMRQRQKRELEIKNIIDIEGVGDVYAKKLQDAGIKTVEQLLEQGATPQGRDEIAAKTGISGALILRWVNHADLIRIVGVAEQFAELLEASGVDSVPELSHRLPENLHAKMVEVNEQKHLVRRLPSVGQISSWIDQCKNRPRAVFH